MYLGFGCDSVFFFVAGGGGGRVVSFTVFDARGERGSL